MALVVIDKAQGGWGVVASEYGLRGMLPGQLRAWIREHFPEMKGNALTSAVAECVSDYRNEAIRHATQEYVKSLRAGGIPAGKYTRQGRFFNLRVEIPRKADDKPAITDADRVAAKVGKLLSGLPATERFAVLDRISETVSV